MLQRTETASIAVPTAPPANRPDIGLRVLLALVAIFAIVIPTLVVLGTPDVAPVEQVERIAKRDAQRVVPKEELPPVEPAEFVPVTREEARAYNATIPFSTAPLLPARPFRITGGEEDRARAVDCLAAAVLYEAGDDPVGQKAVAQVVINRVRHPAFPNSVCGVVFQGSERETGCQFTFTCDGALTRTYSDAAWKRAQEVARAALTGTIEEKVGLATHYHTDWVVPYWSSSLDKVSEVHSHLFFRWTGWWGTPPAFTRAYAGSEPRIAELARLSHVHAGPGGGTLDAEEIAPADLPSPMPTDPNSFLLTLDPRMGPDEFPDLAMRICGERRYCKLMAWSDAEQTPALLPASPGTMNAMTFSYLRDRARGFEKALWNCDVFERPDKAQCMKRRILLPPARRTAADAAEEKVTDATAVSSKTSARGPVPLAGVRRRTGTLAPPVVPTQPPSASATLE